MDNNGSSPAPAQINPWRDIFTRPRATARWLLANETPRAALIMWLAYTAFSVVMMYITMVIFPDDFSRAHRLQLIKGLPVIFAVALLFYYVESWLLYLFCRLLGGQANLSDIRIVNSFSTAIPGAVFLVASLPVYLLVGLGTAASAIKAFFLLWTLYISMTAVAEAAGIALWRSVAAFVGSLVIWAIWVFLLHLALKTLLPRLPTVF